MIKFKKMSTFAKVGAVGVVATATGVAIIPVINTFIDNPKSKVHVYEFNGRLFKTKTAAEDARKKFTAMSGLIKAMNEDDTLDPNLDYKPLMAEFVSFVSKLFTVKIFEMDKSSSKENHFKYDGLSKEQKQELLQQEVKGELKYGDLKDITSVVKYATAHKKGNEWMFTPVDEMLLSIIGDGSGQAYSQNELDYATINKNIQRLKEKFAASYQDRFTDKIGGLAYSLVTGMTHHNDLNLKEADRTLTGNQNVDGDFSGDFYTQEFINKYEQWGTLKSDMEAAKIDLNSFVSAENIKDEMKPVLKDLVDHNAVAGWNNKERYSTEEIELRDLLAKVISQTEVLKSQTLPGDHEDTSVNIVEGWNWKPTGDQSDSSYSKWQLDLAENIQNRQKLLSMHIAPAPKDAVVGLNSAAIGDGTGNEYDSRVFQLRDQLKASQARIDELSAQIDLATTANTVPAPKDGEVSPSGKHLDAIGLGDGLDHTEQFEIHSIFKQLQDAIKSAQEAKDELDQDIASSSIDTNNEDGSKNSMSRDENEANLLAVLQFDIIKQGWNWNKNYNEDQVNYAKDLDKAADLRQKIQDLENNGVVAAKEGASTTNKPPRGLQNGLVYAQEQIDLRDYKKQLQEIGVTLGKEHDQAINRAPKNAIHNPFDPNLHESPLGLGNGQTYSSEFIEAANKYRAYLSKLQGVQDEMASIQKEYPGLVAKSSSHTSFADLFDHHAVSGENTKEQFSVEEVKYTRDKETYDLLVSALSTANNALAEFKKSVTNDKYEQQLTNDFSKHITPIKGENVKATGDGTGHTYTTDDKKFYDAMKTINHTFPQGNPWWTKTTNKKSDDAYYALYDDWKAAIQKGTTTKNTPKVGDGTEHVFKDENFKVFDSFFRKAFEELHGSDAVRSQQISSDFDVILKYIQVHGDLKMDRFGSGDSHGGFGGGGWVELNANKATTNGERKFGDGSGHTYLNLYDIYRKWAIFSPNSSSQKNIVNYQKDLDQLKAKVSAGVEVKAAQKVIDDYNDKIDARQKEIDALQVLVDNAKDKFDDANQDYIDQMHKADGLKNGFTETELKAMALVDITKDNHAVKLTQEISDKLKELDELKDDIKAAKKDLKEKKKQVSEMQQDSNRDFFLRFQALDKNLPVTGHNYIGSGDQSGNTYSTDQINGRDFEKRIESEIKKHPGVSLSDELSKLETLKENSEIGDNTTKETGGSVGDTSGQHWDSWEIELRAKIFSLRKIRTRLTNNHLDFAPDGAEQGFNPAPRGDRTGNVYDEDDEFITKFIPKYQSLLNDQKNSQDALDSLNARKDAIDKLNINKDYLKDPSVYYVNSKGDAYKISDISKAKAWKTAHDLKGSLEKIKKSESEKLATAKSNFDEANKDTKNLVLWNKGIDDQKKIIAKYSDKAVADAQEKVDDAQKKVDDAKKDVLKWWTDTTNSGKEVVYLDTTSKDRGYEEYKVANTFEGFTSQATRNDKGNIDSLFHKLTSIHADTRGRVNYKSDGYYTQEEIDLKNALVDIIDLPDTYSKTTRIDKYSYIFNTLIVMYKNSIDKGYDAREEFWTNKYSFKDSYIKTIDLKDDSNNKFSGATYSTITLKNHSAGAMVSFKEWINQYLSGNTEKVNHAFKGDGSGKVYSGEQLNFFVNKGDKIDSVQKLDSRDFELGQAAFTLKIFNDSAQKMTDKSIEGKNKAATGDATGNVYSEDDMKYFRAYLVAQKAKSDTDDAKKVLDADMPTDGTILKKVPVTYKGTGVAEHSLPVGDGTGNTYTEEEIATAKRYHALLSLESDDKNLIADLEKEWNEKVLVDKRSWDEVKTIDAVAEVGWNHPALWSNAEFKYDGDNVKQDDLQAKIAGLESGTISDPNYKGSGTPPQIAVTPAPDGAVVGLNNALEGLGDNEIFELKQIEKRDKLKDLNQQLTAILETIQDFVDKKTIAAPSADIVPVKMEDWHPVKIGDGSNKFYSNKIFDDRLKLAAAKQEVMKTTAALDSFKAQVGEAALKAIEQEIRVGKMVDGVNEEVKYSIAEIALRDNIAFLGDEKDNFKLLQGNPFFDRQKLLSEDSIPGINTVKKGLGDNRDYSEQEIDLRDVENKIKLIETSNGINSEEQIVSYENLFTKKIINTGLKISEYYNKINLAEAIIGQNHASHGDQSDAFYTKAELNTFNDVVALQKSIATNKQRIAELKSLGINPAPIDEEPISTKDISADPSDYGKHKTLVGDGSGNSYKQDYLDMALSFVVKTNTLEDNQAKLDIFISENPILVRFFKIKTAVDPKTNKPTEWHPVSGMNWSKQQFELKDLIDKRDNLEVGRTMVDSSSNAASKFGVNLGYFGKENPDNDNLVMYKEVEGKGISDEILGSDKARVGYALKINGIVTDESPVLDSLEAVAQFIQAHEELATPGLINRFALLQNLGTEDTSSIYEIKEETVSKDRFNAMAANYEWGDK